MHCMCLVNPLVHVCMCSACSPADHSFLTDTWPGITLMLLQHCERGLLCLSLEMTVPLMQLQTH
jgi:hypothetical protein